MAKQQSVLTQAEVLPKVACSHFVRLLFSCAFAQGIAGLSLAENPYYGLAGPMPFHIFTSLLLSEFPSSQV